MSAEHSKGAPQDGEGTVDYKAMYEYDHPDAVRDPKQAYVEAHAAKDFTEQARALDAVANIGVQDIAAINAETPPSVQDPVTANEVARKQQLASGVKAEAARLSDQADMAASAAGEAYKLTQMDHEFTRVENNDAAVIEAKREDLGRDLISLGEEQIYAGQVQVGGDNVDQGKDFLEAQAAGKLSTEQAKWGNEADVDAARAAIRRIRDDANSSSAG